MLAKWEMKGGQRRKLSKRKQGSWLEQINKVKEKTDTISDLNAKCSAVKLSALDSANRAFGILKRKHQTLKELMSQSKSNLVKEIRQDQLSVVRDSNNNDIVLDQGRFGVCKLAHVFII